MDWKKGDLHFKLYDMTDISVGTHARLLHIPRSETNFKCWHSLLMPCFSHFS